MKDTARPAADPGCPPRRSRVLVIDDHPVTRLGAVTLIGGQRDLAVCGEAGGPSAAIELVPKLAPDLALVDLAHGTMGGIELIKDIKALRPQMKILVMSMQDESIYAERALRAGASGFIMKRQPVGDILAAVRCVLAGEPYLSETMKERVLSRLVKAPAGEVVSPIDTLTDRELDVFRLVGNGFKTNQIAARLHVSSKTVDSHRDHVRRKLGLGGGGDLVRHAIQWAKSEMPA